MSKSAPRALFAATAFLLGSTALYAADMPVKAPPLPLQFSWAGAYIGVNAGAVLDRNDLGQMRLTSPGFVFIDPTGRIRRLPEPVLRHSPARFSSVPINQSRAGASFIGGGQIGYNFQSGNIVYGVEADFQVMRNRDTLSGAAARIHARRASDRQHHAQHVRHLLHRAPMAGDVPRPLRLRVGPAAGLRDRRSRGDQPQDRRQLHLPDPHRSGAGPVSGSRRRRISARPASARARNTTA